MDQYFELLDRISDIREMTEQMDIRNPDYQRAKLDRLTRRRERGM